jgi:YaiO family outer membrane protein
MKQLMIFSFTFAAFAAAQEPSFEQPAYETALPMRLEVGTNHSYAGKDYGYWRGADVQLWIRYSKRFIPVLTIDSQTRPQGTQQTFGFFSYMNWTKSFYTTQGVSFAPQLSPFGAVQPIYFPKQRYDVKAYYKLPSKPSLVLDAGITYVDYGGPLKGEIFSTGFIYYPKKMVIDGNLFVNHNQPGGKVTAAGSLSAQYGREGKYWIGATVSGGHEAYRYFAAGPVDVNLNGYSTQVFFRKWMSRHTGFVLSLDQQTKFSAYSRIGVIAKMFFEF